MKRRSFFKKLGGAVVGLYLAAGVPKIPKPLTEKERMELFLKMIEPILKTMSYGIDPIDFAKLQPMTGPPGKVIPMDIEINERNTTVGRGPPIGKGCPRRDR